MPFSTGPVRPRCPAWIRAVWLLIAVGVCPVSAEALEWQAGAAKIAITPQTPMWMAGYASRDHVAEGKLSDLWAKALVLQAGNDQRVLLVSLDLIGIDRELSMALRDAISDTYDWPADAIAFCTSHTHSGPVVSSNLRPMHFDVLDETQQKLISTYAEQLKQKMITVVGDALASVAAVDIFHGTGYCTFAVNRRNNREPDVPELRRLGRLVGPVDHDVPVLAVRAKTGELRAVVFGYACHATVLSAYQWSGDYPGHAQAMVEADHPECVAMFWAGCGADQNPVPRRDVELAQKYGRQLATSVEAVLGAPMEPLDGQLQAIHREIPLPFDRVPTREEWEVRTESKSRYEAARARFLLSRMDAGIDLAEPYPFPVATWRLGGRVDWIFLGGEVVVDFSLRLKHETDRPVTWVTGYANDVMAYIPSRRVLLEGGYEGAGAMVYYGLPTRWGEDVEQRIVAEVAHQRQALSSQ